MKKEQIKLFGTDLFITERTEYDVYSFEEFSKNKEDKTSLDVKYEDALFIHQGLKFNYENLCLRFSFGNKDLLLPFRPIKYFLLKKKLSPKYLFRHLRISERSELINKIWFLENDETYDNFVKKKVQKILEKIKEKSAEKLQTT